MKNGTRCVQHNVTKGTERRFSQGRDKYLLAKMLVAASRKTKREREISKKLKRAKA